MAAQLRTNNSEVAACTDCGSKKFLVTTVSYRIAGNFRGVQFSLFLRLIGKPRKLNPRNKVLACN